MAASDARKKTLFDDSDDESDGGVKLQINSEYAKRFEHNKKREELQRLEEKYKSKQTNGNKSKDDDESDSSSDEEEDENGFLATEDLDAEISATLQAIKNRDPRVYDGKTKFYKPIDESATTEGVIAKQKKEKPVFLQDYHREKILRGDTGADFDDEQKPPQTYAQEQDDLKQSIKDEIKAQLGAEDGAEDSDSDEDFIKAKEGTKSVPEQGIHPSRASKIKAPKPELEDADKDPELFLSNFMAARAWVEEDENNWKAFESDDNDEVDKADEWEAAYNLRFEDPNKSNEVLKSYARDVVAARSVRREDKSMRKRQRELEREKKEEEKQKRKEERARLRRLKLDEAEEKLKKIKKAAGLSGKTLKDEEWQKLLEDAWEDDKWEEQLKKTFDDQYYAAAEENASGDDEADGKKSKKIKKPKWDDDIDIKDIIPDFDDEERPNITLTDNEHVEEDEDEDEDEDAPSAKRQKTTKQRKREKLESQKEVRQERAKLEAFVDAKMEIDDPEILAGSSSRNNGPARFSYRETVPESFGLTTRDILMASDADLNEFAGLKKLAHFRPQDKQSKDRKRLGKKARLRQWRKQTFGPEFEREPPAFNPAAFVEGDGDGKPKFEAEAGTGNNIIEGGSKKKRKRSRAKKSAKQGEGDEDEAEAVAAA
ncbi:Krr1-domain-containing protein [Daldinia vernicosa]|uniref:Krr1-domain-containing protein n=1 Tax=Daldinia vernicosa TaxID=114800 RepID=UPI0020074936|nr:Krr1-domain-containing protein [Daldinia vernicosa]KAI0847736.1 Krr1-domain-containing protein [Daldinia vernicosa]